MRRFVTGSALLLAILTRSMFADQGWAPSPLGLQCHLRDARWVVIGRLTDIVIEETPLIDWTGRTPVPIVAWSMVRSGSGRIATTEVISGINSPMPDVRWSDTTSAITRPSRRLDQFKDRHGVWFIHVTETGSFDSSRSEFWEFGTVERLLAETALSAPLSPELQKLRDAIQRNRDR